MHVSEDFQIAFSHAIKLAQQLRHEYVTPEHLCWGLVRTKHAKIIESIQACGGDAQQIQEELLAYLEREIPQLPAHENEKHIQPQPTRALTRVLSSAQQLTFEQQRIHPSALDLWLSILAHDELDAYRILWKAGVQNLRVKQFLAHGTVQQTQEQAESPTYPEASFFQQYGICLTQRAHAQQLDSVIGRETLIANMGLDLQRRRKRNLLLVGEAGVGKTSVVEGFASYCLSEQAHSDLRTKRIWSIDAGSLVAGTKFRGDFEDRIKQLIQLCEQHPDIVLFIDEIHLLIGMGSNSNGVMDAANLLKPALSRGTIQLIGATTEKEARQIFEKDKALRRRFVKHHVPEPSLELAEQMMHGAMRSISAHHHVTFDTNVAKLVVQLAHEHVRDLALPDSAIDLLDHVASRHRYSKEPLSTATVRACLGLIFPLASHDRSPINLQSTLSTCVFGQPDAIQTVVRHATVAQAGLNHPDKPLGSFYFVGPTGVGKTELASQFAQAMCLPLVRFDLSEYQEAHAISKLIGSPPGYVGYQEGGQLLAALRKHPACVLLLDEFDKAHPALAKLFLQGLDYGTMTDNQGEVINLRQSYVILTSNQGVQYQTTSKSIGFIASSSTQVDMQQLKESLAPEFRNRLDAIVPFKSLDLMHMGAVVSKALAQLQKRLDGRITLMYDTVFCEHVARVASQADMGARPIARWVDEHLRFPIAERLLEQNPPHGSLLSLTWCSDSNKPLFTDFALQHQAEKVTIND